MTEAPRESFQERLARAMTLLPACRHLTGTPDNALKILANRLLHLPSREQKDARVGRSGLNADEAPLQLAVTAHAAGLQCRLIADPASHEPSPLIRYLEARQALPGVLEAVRAQTLAPLIGTLLNHVVSNEPARIALFTHGVFWLGASAKEPGLALYADATIDPREEAWKRLSDFLRRSLDRPRKALEIVERFADPCPLSSVGLEGMAPDACRIKFYANMPADIPDGFLGALFPPIALLGQSGCFQRLMGELGLAEEDIYLNVGLNGQSGEIQDVKIDLNIGLLNLEADRLSDAVTYCCHALAIHPIPVHALFERFSVATSFLGLAVDRHGQTRLNLYLKGGL